MSKTLLMRRLGLASGSLGLLALAIQIWMPLPGLSWAALVLVALTVMALAFAPRDEEPAELWTPPPEATPAAAIEPDEVLLLRSEIERHKALEQDLLAAKQAAEAAMMAKGEFLATMSHEIRTPLNGIIPLLDILLSSPLGPDQRDYVQTAFGSARQLLRIVDDILDYSKLEASKLELETVGLNLREVLEGVQRLMEKPAESKNLALTLSIDPAVRLAVRGDPVRLRQVLTNLVSNAVKFTERGAVAISVTRRGETRTHHELRFEVRDSGCGISPESAAKLFKPFSQADASTTRTFGGTGLGLVICKRIIDLMGGQIGVESQVGKGSVFWFQIPLLKAVGDMGSARHQGLQGARVLVLTSDPQLLRRFSVSVPQWGATPVPASNTQEALGKLRGAASRSDTWSYQLLMVDLHSARTTALGLHRNVLREPGLEELRLVYLQGDEAPPQEIVNSQRVLVVPRSTSDGELRQLISRHLEDDGAAAAGTASGTPEVKLHASQAAPAAGSSGVVPSGPKLRGHVLLVEDNPVNRQVAQRLLTLSGLTLDSAENGREAVDMSAQTAYDAIMMDCQMPVLDGYSATREIREREKQAGGGRIPIIAMTANAMVGDREKCLGCGMDDYLSKPLNRTLLEQTIRKWLQRRVDSVPLSLVNNATRDAGSARAAEPGRPAQSLSAARPVAATLVAPTSAATSGQANSPAAAPAAPAKPALAVVAKTTPPINLEIVGDLKDIMGAEFGSLVRVFLEDAPRSIDKLRDAAGRADIEAMVGPAHSLKSTSANLGAMELSALSKQIEFGGRQKNLAQPERVVAELEAEFGRVDVALRGMLND